MLSTLLLALAIAPNSAVLASRQEDPQLTQAPLTRSARAQRAKREQTAGVVRGIYGEFLGTEDAIDEALGGNFSNPFERPYRIKPVTVPVPPVDAPQRGTTTSLPIVAPRVFEVTLTNTGTGWDERFLIGLPLAPLSPAPLLVAFHGYSVSEYDILFNTTYFQEALARGWVVLAPLGAHQLNYGVPYAQANIEAAIDWTIAGNFIDLDRIYGVGFSMGGGVAASYAARHLDPSKAVFAAVVNHTGTTSLSDTFDNSLDPSLFLNPLMFGGTPDQEPFRYLQASTIDYDGPSGTVDQDTDMVRNLSHLPVRSFSVAGDPLAHLVTQTDAFHGQFTLRGGVGLYQNPAGNVHTWSTLNESEVLNWLAPIQLAPPPVARDVRTLADRDGRWFHFDIEQAQAGSLTPFRWKAAVVINRCLIDLAGNLSAISFLPEDLDLDTSQPLEVVLDSIDGVPLEVTVRGYASAPSDVLRGGVSAGGWTYDAANFSVTFVENDSLSFHVWTIQP